MDETFQTDAAHRARQLQNIGTALGIDQQSQAAINASRTFGLGVQGANQSQNQLGAQVGIANQGADLQAQQMGLQGQIANQNLGLGAANINQQSQAMQLQALQQSAAMAEQQRQAQLQAQQAALQGQQNAALDPYAAILGGTNNNLSALLGLSGQSASQQSGLLNALLGYGQDVSNTNYNGQAAANIAGYNGEQALNGALIGSGTNLLGAYLGSQGGYQSQKKPTGSAGTIAYD